MRAPAPELPVAVFGHPVSARQMAVMDAAGTLGFRDRTDPKKNLHGFLPVGAVGLCVEQAGVEFDMLAVILGERQARGGFVEVINHRQ